MSVHQACDNRGDDCEHVIDSFGYSTTGLILSVVLIILNLSIFVVTLIATINLGRGCCTPSQGIVYNINFCIIKCNQYRQQFKYKVHYQPKKHKIFLFLVYSEYHICCNIYPFQTLFHFLMVCLL